jgi:hypothetical protein
MLEKSAQQGRSERKAEAYSVPYVEALSDARTTLEGFYNILITRRCVMTCERCHGLMVSERICDPQGMSSDLCVDGYRCLLCGNIVDATILENRRHSTGTIETRTVSDPHMSRLVAA